MIGQRQREGIRVYCYHPVMESKKDAVLERNLHLVSDFRDYLWLQFRQWGGERAVRAGRAFWMLPIVCDGHLRIFHFRAIFSLAICIS
jgi:hypothetical protein